MSHNSKATIIEQQNEIYYGKEILNRVSFLREDVDFISDSILHPSTKFIFYDQINPLVNKYLEEKLIVLSNGDNQPESRESIKTGLINLDAWKNALDVWIEDNKKHHAHLRDKGKPTILFLGIQDASVGLDLKSLKANHESSDESYLDYQGRYQGIPYYAVDLTNAPELKQSIVDFYKNALGDADTSGVFFTTSRKHTMGFTNREASLYSQGKMFLDWLSRNLFCPGCGSKVIPVNAGGKLQCTSAREAGCPAKNASVTNVSFPRTDAVIITAITNEDRSKVLLSLSERHKHTNMYACTAGFMEPSETVEVATKREIWEETGVVCKQIDIVLTQPWPFPGNLMIGCLGEVKFDGISEQINLGHDRELADARWFDIDFVRKLVYPEKQDDNEDFNPENILIPFPESIAYSLIKLVVDQADQVQGVKL